MKHSKLLFSLCLILGIATYFASCEKKNDNETVYKGRVINTVTSTPFPNLEVKVTDGEHINATVKTDENGQFSILVKFNEINGNYYLLIGDASCAQVRRDFKGFGQAEINLGDIEVEGPKSATITTLPVTNVTAESALSGGKITDDGRAEITARGVCWSKNEYPTVNDSHTTNGTGKGEFQSEIRGLDGGSTYYLRAYATSSMGTSYGEQLKFTTETGFPVVTTDAITNVTATSAVCGGTVTDNAGYQITACGVCWSSTTSYPTVEDSHTTDIAITGHFNSAIVNLERNTTYYVRAYATNKNGTSYGETVSFSTTLGIPVVNTGTVDNITAASATCTGVIVSNSGYGITSCGLCWSDTNPYPTIENSHSTEMVTTGSFSSKMMNLEHNTTYYVRAYATNEKGTGYGESTFFTTVSGLPVVTTGTVSNILASSAVCTGVVVQNSGFAITACGVCWSSSSVSPTINDSHTNEVPSVGGFSSTMYNLNDNTQYYVRAYATNSKGTSYGTVVTFTTNSGMPIVTTGTISNISATSAICAGTVAENVSFPITACGVCWSYTTSTPTIANDHTTDILVSGTFSSTMINLEPNKTYYVRAYATNEKGTGYGKMVSFTTKNGLPEVVTTAVGENLTKTTISTGGQVTSDGGFPVTARGVVWGTLPYPTIEKNTYTTDGAGTGYYTSQITNVDTSTQTYYIRSYATNKNGTSYGTQITITPENYQYLSLKTFSLGGYTYRVYLGLGKLNGTDCETACENLTFGGYSDWFLPNRQEGQAILEAYNAWGRSGSSVQGITTFWSLSSSGGYRYFYAYDKFESTYWYYGSASVSVIKSTIAIRKYRN